MGTISNCETQARTPATSPFYFRRVLISLERKPGCLCQRGHLRVTSCRRAGGRRFGTIAEGTSPALDLAVRTCQSCSEYQKA